MPPGRRKRIKTLTRILRILEGRIWEARRDQTAGSPYAETVMNLALDDWAATRDLLVLDPYEGLVIDRQSPDYHG